MTQEPTPEPLDLAVEIPRPTPEQQAYFEASWRQGVVEPWMKRLVLGVYRNGKPVFRVPAGSAPA